MGDTPSKLEVIAEGRDLDMEMLQNLDMLLNMDMLEGEEDMSMVEEMQDGEIDDEST